LLKRRNELQIKLEPGKPRDAAADITLLMKSFGGANLTQDHLATQLAAYSMAVEDYPFWAVRMAIKNFIRGKADGANPAFLPSSPELASEVNRIVQPYRTEKHNLTAILEAEVYSEVPPEERERMIKRFEALLAELRANGKLQGDAA
jgi:hypothetical protein